ncbi:peptidase M50 [Methanocalculus taiwanensis]|uniref:Peptidase M50 n=1 Tax=Methanocalculus taiwanensis TaxID=106207 RepID=A0ABD4TMJ6_9EURY|nr:peptidase M50 [Methanocalculus taiwanensis]MCQ1539424.1 peptidase M50 [Methanocalculus taiwanensis]
MYIRSDLCSVGTTKFSCILFHLPLLEDCYAAFLLSLITVGVGFVLHELAHKFTAMRYGYWAEFQKDNQMLLVAVAIAALVGVVFSAPGATMIYGPTLSKRENGLISVAGPVTNLLLAIPFGLLFIAETMFGLGWFVMLVGAVGVKINAMLAAFNMLPFGPLDGKKVLAWNPLIFIVVIAVSFALLFGGAVLPVIVGGCGNCSPFFILLNL